MIRCNSETDGIVRMVIEARHIWPEFFSQSYAPKKIQGRVFYERNK